MAIVGEADCVAREQFIRKCIEKIEDCKYWDDLRLIVSSGDKWVATDKGASEVTQIYHMSSGIKGRNEQTRATILFTRKNGCVAPIAIASHTGQGTSQYKIVKVLGGWKLPTDTVDLGTPLTVTIDKIPEVPEIQSDERFTLGK